MTSKADSLTISPFGISRHGKSNKELAPLSPRKFDDNATWTWHPEANFIYKTKYTQWNAFYMQDTINKPLAGFALGPKIPIWYFEGGFVLGAMGRPWRDTSFPYQMVGHVQVLPIFGGTIAARVPVSKHVSIETNMLINTVLDHGVIGMRIDW